MKRICTLLLLALVAAWATAPAQYQRKVVDVPKVDPTTITIDGQMLEAAWTGAARAEMITASGFEIYANKYYREALIEPDYDEMVGRMLWAKDTLYLFMHIDEFVNDSTDLFWDGQWTGDQLFVGLSNRFGRDMMRWYDGNVYASPDGPYHFLILADSVTLNATQATGIADDYRAPGDTAASRTYYAKDIARWGITINKTTGVWDVEMAIYHPAVNAGGRLGFNIGGSTGSFVSDTANGDAYGYYCWQPCVVDSPYAQPQGVEVPSWGGDPGFYTLATSQYWPILQFTPGPGDFVRHALNVPKVDPTAITVDGQMLEPAWTGAARANMITSSGFDIYTNKYYREALIEPDYDEMVGRMLWAKDTLYLFMHIDEFVNDSTDLFWDGQWTGDQLFVGLSNRLGRDMMRWYDGNVYASPDGPYHFLILADSMTLNATAQTNIADDFKALGDTASARTYYAKDIARWGVTINKATGVWDLEMAIYHPMVNEGGRVGFNIGGSTGSFVSDTANNDAYAYYCWRPSVIDSPYAQPQGVEVPSWGGDPGFYTLATSQYWPLLTFIQQGTVGVDEDPAEQALPASYTLSQNYPNPFNPTTTITYGVPAAARVSIVVYNLLGQKVATLVEDQRSAGHYTVSFNASRLASGTYIYQMRADNRIVATQKMLLLK